MSTREILTEIRDYYKKNPNGWIKGRFQDNLGGFCLDGAISNCFLDKPDWLEWYHEYIECRNKLESLIDDSLVAWNDDPARTREEVIALLDKAINE